MPAYLTHKLAATAAFNSIANPEIKRIINENFTEYLSGAQGGDFVYFRDYYMLVAGARTKIYGWLVHRVRPAQFLITACSYVKEHYSEKLMAYFFGYLNHYCQDKYVHPHVYRDTKNISTHTYLEQALDVMYADKFFGIDATKLYREKELLDLISDVDELYKFHKYLAKSVYWGFYLPKGSYDKAYWWWSRVARLTDQPSKFRRFWLKVYNVFLPFDLIAFIYRPKEEIERLYDYEKYYYYVDKANHESVSYMNLVFDFTMGKHDISVLSSTFYNINCLGKPMIDWQERKAFRQAYRNAPTKK
jgi:hypothetical protein